MRTVLLPSLLGLLAVACSASVQTKSACGASTSADALLVTAPVGLPDAAGASPTVQSDPSTATNGVSYLVAWTDTVTGTDGKQHSVVAASLVDEAGKIANDASIVLRPDAVPSDVGGDDTHPVVASNGDGFLVTWMHFDLTATPALTLQGARLDKNGALVDKTPFTIGALAPASKLSGAATAWNGSHYLVTWTRESDDGTTVELDGMLIASDGTKGDAVTIVKGVAGKGSSTTVIATGSEFLVAWDELGSDGATYTIRSTTVDDAGTTTQAAPITVVAQGEYPALATNGSSTFLAWADSVTSAVSASPIDGTGTASTPKPVASETGIPAVAWNGAAYIIASATGYAWLSPANGALAHSGAASTDARPALATTDTTTFLFSTQPDASKNERLFGRLSDANDAPIATVYPARTNAPQEEVATAWDGTHLAAVWTEARGADRDHRELWTALFDASGRPTSAPTRLRDDSTAPHAPTVVANGISAFVVAWTETQPTGSAIAFANLPDSATSKMTAPQFVTGTTASLTVSGAHPLLLVDGLRGYFTDESISDSAPKLTLPMAGAFVWDGTYFVGSWIDSAVIRANRYDAQGVVQPSPLTIADLGKDTPTALALGSDQHGTTLFGWLTTDADGSSALAAKRLANGAIDAEAKRIDAATPGQSPSSPTIAFDGGAWLVGYSVGPTLTCAHLELDGATVDVRETITASGLGHLALSGADAKKKAFVAYQDIEAEKGHALVPRVQLRTLQEPSDPVPPVVNPPVLPEDPTTNVTSSSSSSSSSGGCR